MNNLNPPAANLAATEPTAARPDPVYPLARPAAGADPRFSIGLALDVAKVLADHGYPPLAGGADLQHWQRILFTGIYTTSGHDNAKEAC